MLRKTIFFLSFLIPFVFIYQTTVLFSDEPADNAAYEKQTWLYDYQEALEMAKKEKKMLLVYFKNSDNKACTDFESQSLNDSDIKLLLKDYVLVELPVKSSTRSSIQQVSAVKKEGDLPVIVPADIASSTFNKNASVINQTEFAEMLGKSGVAIVDYKNEDEEIHGKVVSVFPFLYNKPYNVFETKTILALPPGTVTQRSLIYAVRVHPEKPKSTNGDLNDYLTDEAESHSLHQARIRLQGHHNWESRFHKITARLGNHEIWASEVCAESWPGQGLLESAIDCVKCWRHSSGHWSAVSAEHPFYGYDMKRGSNGIWYATGIFGKWKNKRRVQ